jgi:hypothetical protein
MALNGLLSGIASGAGEVYGTVAEEKRQQKIAQDKILAEGYAKQADDPNATDEDALAAHKLSLQYSGVNKKDIEQIAALSMHHRRLQKSQQDQMNNPGGAEGPSGVGAPAQTVTPPAVHVPGQDPNHPDQGPSTQLPATEGTPGLPPMPTYQAPTNADYTGQQAARNAQVMAPVKIGITQAGIEAKMEGLSAEKKREIQDKLSLLENPTEAQVNNLVAGIKTPAMVSAKGSKPISGAQISQNEPGATDVHGGSIPNDPSAMYSQLLNRDGTPAGYVRFSPPSTGKEWIRVPVNESATGWAHETFDQYGNHAGYRMNVMPPASLLPQLKTDIINHIVEQSDGSRVAVPLPNTTTRGPALPAPTSVAPGQASSPAQGGGITDRVIQATAGPSAPLPVAPDTPQPQDQTPGMPAKPPAMPVGAAKAGPTAALPSAGRVVGGRSLTPEQSIKQSQALPMVNLAISKLKFLEANADIFGNAISSGKIALQTDPHQGFIKAVLNKGMTLSPLEADIAATFTKASEEIFLTKNVMGAGSMPRSGEAMDVIEAQKGLVGQSPEVIKRLLHQTLQEFQATHGALATASKKYGFGTPEDRIETPMASAYNSSVTKIPDGGGKSLTEEVGHILLNQTNNDPKAAKALAIKNHWVP